MIANPIGNNKNYPDTVVPSFPARVLIHGQDLRFENIVRRYLKMSVEDLVFEQKKCDLIYGIDSLPDRIRHPRRTNSSWFLVKDYK